MNYFISEMETETFHKDSNTVISLLYHYIQNILVVKPKRLIIYCDNCKG